MNATSTQPHQVARRSSIPATWRDLNDLRQVGASLFPAKDAWPLWDMIGVLTFPGVVRLKGEPSMVKTVGFIAADIHGALRNVAWIATLGVLPDLPQTGDRFGSC